MKTGPLISIFLVLCFPLFSQNTRLYFEFNSYVLPECSQQVLKEKLRDFELSDSVLIIGFADTTGTDSYNMELSKKRAEVTRKWFIDNKVSIPVRITWKGEGGVICPYSGHANRRVEVMGFSKTAGFPKKQEQIFIISNLKDTIIQGKEGTRIRIPANAIVVPHDQPDASLMVSLTEYYKASDILLNHLTTRTEEELLETNGMITASGKIESLENFKEITFADLNAGIENLREMLR